MAKKKILIDARMYGLENAGIGRYLINLTEELKRLGIRSTSSGQAEEQYTILLREKYFNRLKFPSNWEKVLVDYKHYTLIEQIKLPKLIKDQKPDIVHFPNFNIPIFWRGRFVITIHDMTMHRQKRNATNLPYFLYYLKRGPYKYAFKKAVNNSLKIITPTKSVKKELIDYFDIDEDKVVTIHEGFESTFSEHGVKLNVLRKYRLKGHYFIYTGNVYPHKNIKRAVEAIAYLNKNLGIKAQLAIAGSRSVFLKRIEKNIADLDAKEFVRVLGFIPDEDLRTLYKKAVAFIYPSLSEGFGLQGLEAIAAGTLVLASDIPVFREVYKSNVIYFNPFDFSSIAETMRNTIEMRKEKREKIIKNAQEFIKRYSWKKMAQQTLKIYNEVLV
jgi:glycosyltransferase involved in cell wall biosynthesis